MKLLILLLPFTYAFWQIVDVSGTSGVPQLCMDYAENDITLSEYHIPYGLKLPVRCEYTPQNMDCDYSSVCLLESCTCEHPCSDRTHNCGLCSPDKYNRWSWNETQCSYGEELNLDTCECESQEELTYQRDYSPARRYSIEYSEECEESEYYDSNERRCMTRCPEVSMYCSGCNEHKCVNINGQWTWKCAPMCSGPAPAHSCICIRRTIETNNRDDFCEWSCDSDYQDSTAVVIYPNKHQMKTYIKDYVDNVHLSSYSHIDINNHVSMHMWLPDSTRAEDASRLNKNGYNKLFCACVTSQWEKPSQQELASRMHFKSQYKNAHKHCEKIAGVQCRARGYDLGHNIKNIKAVALRHQCGGETPSSTSLGCSTPSIYGCNGRGRMRMSNGGYEHAGASHLILDGNDILSYKCTA